MGKILFIRGGAVGDFILTMPAIQLVREQLPDNEITVLGYPAICELAKATGLVDEIRSIEDAKLAHFFNPKSELDPDWCQFFAGFDVVVSYLFDPDGFFQGNLERAGVETLLLAPFKPKDDAPFQPAALQLAEPLSRLALFPDDQPMKLQFTAPIDFEISGNESDVLIGLHPGSGSPSKNWSFEAWADLLATLHEQDQRVHFVITSGEAEFETISSFLELLKLQNVPHSHVTAKSLLEMGSLFGKLDFYLGHDSGISHLAGSTGIPGLLLFGPTHPEVWAPAVPSFQVIRSSDNTMAGIGVSEVLETLQQNELFTAL